ncbi:thiol-disulfide oxidoreductase DCC family protein [Porticoccus sp.]
MIIVFYDGSCPLCRREINHYMKIARDNLIHWVDISRDDSQLRQFNLSTDEAMRRFHVVDQMGNVAIGVAAFLIMWQTLPGYRHLAHIIRFLHLTPLLELCYEWFAKRRYRRACGRQAGSCANVPGD